MAKAKKLPSGKWNIRVFERTDSTGKKILRSFTAPTKAEAEMLASAYKATKHRIRRNDLTVGEAVEKYIASKEGTLSESTIAGYVKDARQLSPIEGLHINRISSEELQTFISQFNKDHSPKTTKNVMGLVLSAIRMFQPDAVFNVTMPMYVKPKLRIPNDNDIKRLMDAAPRKMKLCIALGCKSVRRGEICAIQVKDIRKDDDKHYSIHIHGDCVLDRHNRWVYKNTPKTPESDRYVLVSDKVVDLIDVTDKDAYIVSYRPNTITQQFGHLARKLGINMNFHSTRHYYASIMAYLGVPDFATAEMGGWKNAGGAMKRIYQNIQEERTRQFLRQSDAHFDDLFDEVEMKVET